MFIPLGKDPDATSPYPSVIVSFQASRLAGWPAVQCSAVQCPLAADPVTSSALALRCSSALGIVA